MIRRLCFATEIRVSARHLLGNKGYSSGREEREPVVISHDNSSLVVDRLCDQVRGKNTAVTCFYFDFAARKEQSATSILGPLLKQMVGGMEKIPEGISRVPDQKKAIGGRRPQLVDVTKMLQFITSLAHIYVH